MFQTILQPFVQWKKKKGFRVIEGYTNNPSVGTTTTTIKSIPAGSVQFSPRRLQCAKLYPLLWGRCPDPCLGWLSRIACNGSALLRIYRRQFPRSLLREVFCYTTAQMQPQIDKTLEYEQYLMPNPSFLGEAVMAAGADASYQNTATGRSITELRTILIRPTILLHTPISSLNLQVEITQRTSIRMFPMASLMPIILRIAAKAAGLIPASLSSDIAAVNNQSKYCLMVGNCCLSCRFDYNCFAEEMLRAETKGPSAISVVPIILTGMRITGGDADLRPLPLPVLPMLPTLAPMTELSTIMVK